MKVKKGHCSEISDCKMPEYISDGKIIFFKEWSVKVSAVCVVLVDLVMIEKLKFLKDKL